MSEQLYVLIKRDLYESPEHQGYTGIKDLAGAWPLSLVKSETVPVKDEYDRGFNGHYALPFDMAPSFTNSCFHDLAQAHLEKKLAAKDAEIERLRDALETISVNMHGRNPSLAYADVPREDYLAHVLWEARKLARKTLAGGTDAP